MTHPGKATTPFSVGRVLILLGSVLLSAVALACSATPASPSAVGVAGGAPNPAPANPSAAGGPVGAPNPVGASSASTGTAVGQLAPAFSILTLHGRAVTEMEFRAVDKPYVLYFYATW